MLDTKWIPAIRRDSKRMLVMMHGLGDSVAGYEWLPEMLGFDWLNYLLVNAPDAYYGGFSWYDFMGDAATGIKRSRRLLFELLDAQRTRGFPAEQILIGGFSQGCLMALEAGFRYPHCFAGVIGISGYAFEPLTLIQEISPVARQQRFLITHGTYDPLIPIQQVKPQIDLFKAHGLNIEWHEFAKEHSIAGQVELKVIRDFIRASYPD